MRMNRPNTNFSHLRAHDEQLVRLGMLAERQNRACVPEMRRKWDMAVHNWFEHKVGISSIPVFPSPAQKPAQKPAAA
jgi:hypothetical protein